MAAADPAGLQDLTAPGGKPGLTPWAPVTIGMGSKVLAAYELDGDASDVTQPSAARARQQPAAPLARRA